ncbi:RhsIA family immunity protein [Myroides sp. M-43]|uniref:NTF2 fold immunity protein n=1 Tax=Myroides oncorhynchi TaxID=2893756 RepID=UPI001E29B7AA|nr:NTF2 fold immunity protein [Myroides oncorhynchi]MCC9042892.1 RhsIA family immunity protein [Myroides oncorhynchi]
MEKTKVKKIVISFIKEMNKREKQCNIIDENNTLTSEEQFSEQEKLIISIFERYCTPKERKSSRPNTISYGYDDCFEYDPKEESIVNIMEDEKSKSKMDVETFKEDPLEEKFMYVLIKKNINGL